MGKINFRLIEFCDFLIEIASFKAGLTIANQDIPSHIPNYANLIDDRPNKLIVLRSDEFESVIQEFLYNLGERLKRCQVHF